MFMNSQMEKVESSKGKACFPGIYQAIFVMQLGFQFPCEFSNLLELFLLHLLKTTGKIHSVKMDIL